MCVGGVGWGGGVFFDEVMVGEGVGSCGSGVLWGWNWVWVGKNSIPVVAIGNAGVDWQEGTWCGGKKEVICLLLVAG